MIVNHLSRLLGERHMPISELQRRTGIPYSSLHPLARGKTKRADFDTLDAICAALGVGIGDLLEHVEVAITAAPPPQRRPATAAQPSSRPDVSAALGRALAEVELCRAAGNEAEAARWEQIAAGIAASTAEVSGE
jgi:putative transcriptional regulator